MQYTLADMGIIAAKTATAHPIPDFIYTPQTMTTDARLRTRDEEHQTPSMKSQMIAYIASKLRAEQAKYKRDYPDLMNAPAPEIELGAVSERIVKSIYKQYRAQFVMMREGQTPLDLLREKYSKNAIYLKYTAIAFLIGDAVYSWHKDRPKLFTSVLREMIFPDGVTAEKTAARMEHVRKMCVSYPSCVSALIQSWARSPLVTPMYLLLDILIKTHQELVPGPFVIPFNCSHALWQVIYNNPDMYVLYYEHIERLCTAEQRAKLLRRVATSGGRLQFLQEMRAEFVWRHAADTHLAMFCTGRRTNTVEKCSICLTMKPAFWHDCRRHTVCFCCYSKTTDRCPVCRFDLRAVKLLISRAHRQPAPETDSDEDEDEAPYPTLSARMSNWGARPQVRDADPPAPYPTRVTVGDVTYLVPIPPAEPRPPSSAPPRRYFQVLSPDTAIDFTPMPIPETDTDDDDDADWETVIDD